MRVREKAFRNTNRERKSLSGDTLCFQLHMHLSPASISLRTGLFSVENCKLSILTFILFPRCVQCHVRILHVVIHPEMRDLGQEVVSWVTQATRPYFVFCFSPIHFYKLLWLLQMTGKVRAEFRGVHKLELCSRRPSNCNIISSGVTSQSCFSESSSSLNIFTNDGEKELSIFFQTILPKSIK